MDGGSGLVGRYHARTGQGTVAQGHVTASSETAATAASAASATIGPIAISATSVMVWSFCTTEPVHNSATWPASGYAVVMEVAAAGANISYSNSQSSLRRVDSSMATSRHTAT